MEDLSLIEAIGVLSAFGDPTGMFGKTDILDPLGIGRPAQLDLFDDGGQIGGYKPKGNPVTNAAGKFKQGLDSVADPRVAKQTQALQNMIGTKVQGPIAKGPSKMGIQRMAGQALKSGVGQGVLKYAPMVGTALSVGDLVLGDESLANKGMDAAMMAGGAALGSVVPVIGTGIGATAGKMASDGLQWLFGDKKSPEERKLEEALAALGGRG